MIMKGTPETRPRILFVTTADGLKSEDRVSILHDLRIYRPDVGTDVVKSTPAGIDCVRSYQFRVMVPELRPMFDGTEQLVSIVVPPWYVRQVFLPWRPRKERRLS
jgi:hypothetical protein